MVGYHSCSRRCPRRDHRGDGLGVGHRRRHVLVVVLVECVARTVTVVRRSDAADSHQPPLPIRDRKLIAHDVQRYAARDPTPRLLDVRMAVEEERTRPRFRVQRAQPNVVVRTLERREQGRPVPLPLAGDNPRPRQCPALPARSGWRAPPTDHRGRRPAGSVPPSSGTRVAGRANRMPPNCRTRTSPRPDPAYSAPARRRCHPAPARATRPVGLGVSQHTLQPVAPAVNVGKDCPDLCHSV